MNNSPEQFVGMKLLQMGMYDLSYRVTSVDGIPSIITADFRPDRLNFKVVNGIITEVSYG